jgi:hypothetical protein
MSYASTIAADTPLSWFRMGDTNATLADSSGNAHDGTYTGTPGTDYTQNQTGLVGDADKAVLFQGTNAGCAQYTYSVSVGTGDFSVEVWAKPAGTGTLVLWSTSSFWLGVASGVLTLSGATGGALTHQTALATGTTYHVVLTRAGGVMTLYLNAVACTTPQADTTSLTGNLMQTVAGLGGSGFEFNGTIDEVAFYGGAGALTPTKVSAHYAAGTAGGGDTTPPTLSGPTVPGAGSSLTATLSEAGCVPASGTGGFSISGTAATVASWAISGTTLTLTLTGLVQAGETVTLSYDRATTTDDITDAAGNFLANFSAAAVTNNSTQGGTTATATFSTTHAAVLRCGQINPGYTAGRAADELISLGSGYDFTLTDCTALSVPFFLAASAGMTVSVDGGVATALTMPATGSWADVVVFSGLATSAHTVSLRLTSGSRMLAIDAVNSFKASNVGSLTTPTISATKAGPVYPVGKATFRRNASVDGAVVLVPSLNTGTYNAPLLDLPAYVGQRVAFQSDATELRFFMAGQGQKFSLVIDGVVTGAQVTVPADGLNEWRTIGTGLDGANHTYAVQNDLPGMYLIYSVQTVGGTLTTHAFPAAGNLVVYGDSISVAAGTSRASKGYAAQVARAKGRRLINLAVSGSAVSSSVDVGRPGLVTEFAGDYLNWAPTGWDTSQDEVVILAGFNDSNYIDDLPAFTNAYSLALDGLAATGATVRVLGYLDTAAAQASANRTAWNSALSSLVSGLGLARITYHDTTGWVIPASDCVDGIHLNQSGDDKVATQLDSIVTTWTAPSGGGGGTYTDASNVRSGTDRGDGVTGTLVVPPANKVVTGTVFDNGTVGSANVLSVLITTP